jgi:hypothetical protein
MENREITIALMAVATVLLVVWDIYVATNREPGDTISEILLGWARRIAFIPYAAGVISGHLFWPAQPLIPVDPVLTATALLVVGTLGTAAQLMARSVLNGSLAVSTVIHFLVGFLLGHWLWPQW